MLNGDMTKLFYNIRSFSIPERWQSETLRTIDECGSQTSENSVLDCPLSPVGQQMTIKNFVTSDRGSLFFDSINVAYLKCLLNKVLNT